MREHRSFPAHTRESSTHRHCDVMKTRHKKKKEQQIPKKQSANHENWKKTQHKTSERIRYILSIMIFALLLDSIARLHSRSLDDSISQKRAQTKMTICHNDFLFIDIDVLLSLAHTDVCSRSTTLCSARGSEKKKLTRQRLFELLYLAPAEGSWMYKCG